MAASFTSLELAERVADGIAPTELATELVFWLGLAATVPITVIYSYVLRAVSDVAVKVLDCQPLLGWPSIIVSLPPAERSFGAGGLDQVWSRWSRGPPFVGCVDFV